METVHIPSRADVRRWMREMFREEIALAVADMVQLIGLVPAKGPRLTDDSPVHLLGFDARILNMCDNANIQTIGDLCRKSRQEILKYRNVGPKILQTIVMQLAKQGRALSE